MIIKKFQANTEEAAVQQARDELGSNAVIMNIKVVKPKGIFGLFKSSTVEVTAAAEEKEPVIPQLPKKPETVQLAADEAVKVPVLDKKKEDTSVIEERLDSLQQLLEKQWGDKTFEKKEQPKENVKSEESKVKNENLSFIKLIYGVMLENEVDEKYANQIIDETERIMKSDKSVDYILSNLYQKMILKFGQPKEIELSEEKPKVVFFVGPTGVGKTTTIAKLASKFKLEDKKKVALITADTYRIAATEQLRTYANILDAPFSVIYSLEELEQNIEKVKEYDLVLVDTAGHSHRNEEQKENINQLLHCLGEEYEKETYLVLSATTKYKDLLEIVDSYSGFTDYSIIFTKLDETSTYGNILNIKLYSGVSLSYITNGQNVPDDLEVLDTQSIVKKLLGGK
ncbi:flagellar biosynthesis protein FlhF [Anaerosacchariphilus polymeriproducens]|uniref:Flagellar biosynthesis protein FlhF n=1 Tax=Anaerosacchariphilus polymeriproducens TaxID=1812858 RepID=A0A371AS80_9FIRM|nr:flagellar biosynthesis protein FlhF [Anaerosacchariphilus polymeriproducens]RDU22415.1 flagellar biosynthesis protein FlhF [Anaerosacchariphilus polymeriproducens]